MCAPPCSVCRSRRGYVEIACGQNCAARAKHSNAYRPGRDDEPQFEREDVEPDHSRKDDIGDRGQNAGDRHRAMMCFKTIPRR